MQGLCDELLADMRSVRFGGIDEIYPKLDRALQHANCLGAIARRAPDTVARDAHRSEAEAVYRKIAAEGESATMRCCDAG